MTSGYGYRTAFLLLLPLLFAFTSLNCTHNRSASSGRTMGAGDTEQVEVSQEELNEIRSVKERVRQQLPVQRIEWVNHLGLENELVGAWTGPQHIYLQTAGHELWAVSRRTGDAEWVYSMSSTLKFPPTLVGNLPSRVREVERQLREVKDQLSREQAAISPDQERISELQSDQNSLKSQLNDLRSNDRIYLIAGTTLHAVDRKLGYQVDQTALEFAPSAQPFATTSRVVIPGYHRNFVHFFPHDTLNENLEERVRLDGPIETQINQTENLFLLPSMSGTIYAYSLEQGWVWRTRTDGEIKARPLVHNGNVILASKGMQLYSLNRFSGNSNWVNHFESSISQTPQVSDSTIYVHDDQDRFSAVHASSGKLKWRHENGPDSFLFRHNQQVYTRNDGKQMVSVLSADSGEVLNSGSYEPFSYLLPNQQRPVFLLITDRGLIVAARASKVGVEITTENIERTTSSK